MDRDGAGVTIKPMSDSKTHVPVHRSASLGPLISLTEPPQAHSSLRRERGGPGVSMLEDEVT